MKNGYKILVAIVVLFLCFLLIKECRKQEKPALIPPAVIINKTDSIQAVYELKIDSVEKVNALLKDRLHEQRETVRTIYKDRIIFKDRVKDTVNCYECEAEVLALSETLVKSEAAMNETFLTTDSIIGGLETVIDYERIKYDSLRRSFDLMAGEYKRAYDFIQKPKSKPKRLLWFAAGVVVGGVLTYKLVK